VAEAPELQLALLSALELPELKVGLARWVTVGACALRDAEAAELVALRVGLQLALDRPAGCEKAPGGGIEKRASRPRGKSVS